MAPKRKPKSQLSKSAKYYRKSAAARKKKAETDRKINEKPKQKAKRAESGRKRYAAKKAGKSIKNKDYHHGSNSFIDSSKNRGMKGEGGRKKRANRKKK